MRSASPSAVEDAGSDAAGEGDPGRRPAGEQASGGTRRGRGRRVAGAGSRQVSRQRRDRDATGLCPHRGGRIAAAAAAYARALALDDTRLDAWLGRGCAEFARSAYAKAVRSLEGALALRPQHPRAHFHVGSIDAAIENFRIAARARGLRADAIERITRMFPGAPAADNAAILEARRQWAALETRKQPQAKRTAPRAGRNGRLRIGYVSAFFPARNYMKPVWGVINHHDRARFEIHLFAEGGGPDKAGGYLRDPSDCIHDVTGLSNGAVSARIARLGIDVLVDLNG